MPGPISEARVRAQRYWYRDGLAEIALGVIVLLQIGGNLIIASHYEIGIAIYFLLLFSLAIYARRMMDALRERITYRRGGYAHELASGGRILVVMGSALATGVLCVVFRYVGYTGRGEPAGWDQWFPALVGLAICAVEFYVSMRYGLRRALVVGIFSIILGVVVSMECPLKLALTIWCAGFGCANLCSGGVALLTYLRTTPSVANMT